MPIPFDYALQFLFGKGDNKVFKVQYFSFQSQGNWSKTLFSTTTGTFEQTNLAFILGCSCFKEWEVFPFNSYVVQVATKWIPFSMKLA